MSLVARAVGFGVDNDLRPIINDGQSVVALKHTTRATHLGALGIGQVALLLVAGGSDLFLPVLEKLLNLGDLSLIVLGLLGVFHGGVGILFLSVAVTVSRHEVLGDVA